jgi:hypothetical protein
VDRLYEPDAVDQTESSKPDGNEVPGPTWAPVPGTIQLESDVPAEILRLQAEVAILQARLQASEELARERAERIADLRVILRMLPSTTDGSGPAPSPRIWVSGRTGSAAANGPAARANSVPDASHIWAGAAAATNHTPVGPEAPPRSVSGPPQPARPIPDWREDFSDMPRRHGRHARPRRRGWFPVRRRVRRER